jgi:DNA-binding FrmR family transcriptional regulator
MECKCCDRKTIRNEEEKKKLNSRINRIIGQLEGIKRMVDDDRYCGDILIQLSASDKAIKSLASIVLDNHMHSCVLNSVKEGDTSKIDEIVELFRRFS